MSRGPLPKGRRIRDKNRRVGKQNVSRHDGSTERAEPGIAGKVQGMLGGATIRHAKAEWSEEQSQDLLIPLQEASVCAPSCHYALRRFTMADD